MFSLKTRQNFTPLNLSSYIKELLYRYECVIVPEFGGFVTNTKSAIISSYSNTFYPPHKIVTFNSHLKNNDGLLANYIAATDQVPYESAINFIKFEVAEWFEVLKETDLELEDIGKFSLDGNATLHFESHISNNFLTDAHGLSPIAIYKTKREEYLATAPKAVITPKSKPVKKENNWIKYAAVFVIGLSLLGLAGNAIYQNYTENNQLKVAHKEQKNIEHKIEKATFVVTEALPSISFDVSLNTKPYHLIAGAFRYPENAQRLVNKLIEQGYDARILGVNKWGLTQVSFNSYTDRNEAINNLYNIQRNVNENAWLLVQDL
ncbi:MAG: hypothetical protein CR989_02230 [Flavobacteriales bacterium]|nr:MAG: hypothetical protein CR989_02230 [Flavobacteriales bacterium]